MPMELILFLLVVVNVFAQVASIDPPSNMEEIVLFQFVEQSFFELWLNWWNVAISVGLFKQGNYSLHITCLGDSLFFDEMRLFSPSGCDDKILVSDSPQFKGRIYYAKWSSFTDAFVKHGKNMILCDIDAVLIRDPMLVLMDGSTSELNQLPYDIIGSRDHGHDSSSFPYSDNWGTARFCAGFLYFRYSVHTDSLARLVLRRLKKYGQGDQICLNNLMAQSGVMWHSNVSFIDDDRYAHRGDMLWYNQHSPEWVSEFAKNKQDADFIDALDSKAPVRLKVKLLNRHQVLRYCNRPLKSRTDMLTVLAEGGAPLTNRAAALHCFHPQAYGLGEQGYSKSQSKQQFMSQMGFWVLKSTPVELMDEYTRNVPGALRVTNSSSTSTGTTENMPTTINRVAKRPRLTVSRDKDKDSASKPETILSLIRAEKVPFIWELIRDRGKVNRLLDIWIHRDHARDDNLLSHFE